jgi:Protein of unknown function (DUF3617)
MPRFAAIPFVMLMLFTMPALSAELPSRKPGLWEVQTSFSNGKVPAQVIRQCVDAATDQMMQSRVGVRSQKECSKRDLQKSAGSITIDSICTGAGGKTRTSHIVITGSFDSAYTMTVTSQNEEATESRTITMAAKWIGPCAADQKPGDMIMANGKKINLMDAQKLGAPPDGRPAPR